MPHTGDQGSEKVMILESFFAPGWGLGDLTTCLREVTHAQQLEDGQGVNHAQ